MSVDPITGDRTTISGDPGSFGANVGTGPDFDSDGPSGIVIDRNGDILVADRFAQAIFRIDPATGNRAILSGDPNGANVGAEPDFPDDGPLGLALEATGNILVSQRAKK